jgi:hypothetical protein
MEASILARKQSGEVHYVEFEVNINLEWNRDSEAKNNTELLPAKSENPIPW